MTKKKLYALIAGGIAVVLAIATTIVLVVTNNTNTPQLEKTEVGKQIQSVLTVDNRPASTIAIAPATEKWWTTLTSTLPEGQLSEEVKWDLVSKNASYISSTVSGGGSYDDYYKYNLNTLIVAYKTVEDLNKVAEKLPPGASYLVSNNLLLFTPGEAFSDLDYALDAYESTQERIAEDDIKLDDEALLTIDLRAMVDNLIIKQPEQDEKDFLNKFADLFGLEVGASWVGKSPDGITWEGEFHGLNKLPTTKEVDDLFYSTVKAVDGDKIISPDEITDPEWGGFIEEHQYRALVAMAIRTNDKSIGMASVTAGGPGVTGPGVLPKEEGVYEIQFAVNNFLALVQDRHMTYPYTNAGVVTITLKDAGGKSTIKFEDLKTAQAREEAIIKKTEEDMLQNVGNGEGMTEEDTEYYDNIDMNQDASPTEEPSAEEG